MQQDLESTEKLSKGRPKDNACLDCGIAIHRVSKRCKSCANRVTNGASFVSYTERSLRRREASRQRIVNKRLAINVLKENPCTDCNKKYPFYVMDFDHRAGEKKVFGIKEGVSSHSLEDIYLEIQKCDLVCANCHRERTYQRTKE